MEIHVIEQLNVALKTIVPFAPVQLALLAIHLSDVSWSHHRRSPNVLTIMNARHQKHVLIKRAVIHAPNVTHALSMLNVEQYNTIQPAIVQLDGPVIPKISVTNVSYSSISRNNQFLSMDTQ